MSLSAIWYHKYCTQVLTCQRRNDIFRSLGAVPRTNFVRISRASLHFHTVLEIRCMFYKYYMSNSHVAHLESIAAVTRCRTWQIDV